MAPIARHLVIEGLRDGVTTLDPQDRIVDVNPVAQRLLGRSADQDVGSQAADVLTGISDLQFPLQGDDLSEEVVFDQDGEEFTYELRVTALRDRRRELPEHIIVCNDITERKRAEEATQPENRRSAERVTVMPPVR